MSQIPLTDFERTAALQRFGYNECEAAFLAVAALHSGYFLRRQYLQFLGGKDGGRATRLLSRALGLDHVKTSTWRQNTQLYHLCTRPFYEALGQGENRHRRARALPAIKAKIMALDFVLAHQTDAYLATEQEKFAYFTDSLGLDSSLLPAKLYRATKSSLTTTRYFIEKYPIFLRSEAPLASPVVAFCFVDPGAASLSGFQTFLEQYGRLFPALQRFEVLYVADQATWLQPAGQTFKTFLNRMENRGAAHPRMARLLEYFEMRRLYDSRELASFDRTRLIRFREMQRDFSGANDEALYAHWRRIGDEAFRELLDPKMTATAGVHGTFSTCLLEHDYGLFGRFIG